MTIEYFLTLYIFWNEIFLATLNDKLDTTALYYKDTKIIFLILILTYISINSVSREVSSHSMLKMKLCWLDKKVYLILILKNVSPLAHLYVILTSHYQSQTISVNFFLMDDGLAIIHDCIGGV